MHVAREIELLGGGLIGEKGAVALSVQQRQQEQQKCGKKEFPDHKGMGEQRCKITHFLRDNVCPINKKGG